jgi:zinc protease
MSQFFTAREAARRQPPRVGSDRMRIVFALCLLAASVGTNPLVAAQPAARVKDLPIAIRNYRVPIVHTTLRNGLHVVVSVERGSPIVAVNVMYGAGYRSETPGRSGLAHLFEHLMFQGTDAVGRNDYAGTINGLGGRFFGATRSDYASYYSVAPANALDLLLWIEADRMRSLKLTRETLDNQRAVVREEVRMSLNQPAAAFDSSDLLPGLTFAKWPNAHNSYGDVADLEATTVEDMVAFRRRYYAPSNAVLVVVGGCDVARVLTRAREYFEPISAGEPPAKVDLSERAPGEERSTVQVDRKARNSAIAIAYRLPPRLSRDFLALSLVHTLMTRDERGLLPRALIDETGVATRVAASFHALGNDFDALDPMLYSIRIDCSPHRRAADVLAHVDRVVGRIAQGVSAQDMALARLRFGVWWLDQLGASSSPYASRARMLAAFTLFDGAPDGVNRILPTVATLTADDLARAARTYLAPANRVWIERRTQ